MVQSLLRWLVSVSHQINHISKTKLRFYSLFVSQNYENTVLRNKQTIKVKLCLAYMVDFVAHRNQPSEQALSL